MRLTGVTTFIVLEQTKEKVMDGYCEKHKCAYEIKPSPAGWVCECPKCRAEGLLDTITTDHTEIKPQSEWTVSNKTTLKRPIT